MGVASRMLLPKQGYCPNTCFCQGWDFAQGKYMFCSNSGFAPLDSFCPTRRSGQNWDLCPTGVLTQWGFCQSRGFAQLPSLLLPNLGCFLSGGFVWLPEAGGFCPSRGFAQPDVLAKRTLDFGWNFVQQRSTWGFFLSMAEGFCPSRGFAKPETFPSNRLQASKDVFLTRHTWKPEIHVYFVSKHLTWILCWPQL